MVRWLLGPLVVYRLAIVLASSTPLGGVVDWKHAGQRFEPLWPHLHLVDGRIVPAGPLEAPADSIAPPAVTAGESSGPEHLTLGLALTPLPAGSLAGLPSATSRLWRAESSLWRDPLAAPPDPPRNA